MNSERFFNKSCKSEGTFGAGSIFASGKPETETGRAHEDWNAQFIHINKTTADYISNGQSNGQPVISVDCKRKEDLGEFTNKGAENSQKGKLVTVLDHDFYDYSKGKAVPHGTYDVTNNEGYVNVGISHDTARFAVNAILCMMAGNGTGVLSGCSYALYYS